MCGIALIVGAGADPGVFRQMTRLLAARGETEESILAPGLFACTQRLRIVDRDHAVQPWLSADRRWLLCVYRDPDSGRMNLRSIPDRAPQAVAAATTTTAN